MSKKYRNSKEIAAEQLTKSVQKRYEKFMRYLTEEQNEELRTICQTIIKLTGLLEEGERHLLKICSNDQHLATRLIQAEVETMFSEIEENTEDVSTEED